MIIGNLLFWGLLIFVAVLVARYVRQGNSVASHPLSPRHNRSRHNDLPAER